MPPHYTTQDDFFSSRPASFLAPSKSTPGGTSHRSNPSSRKSSASFHTPLSLAHALSTTGDNDEIGEEDDAGNRGGALNGTTNGASRQHSLAHELAFALMPEPSTGSKLLAEEFGIEYDEGAEGIDEPVRKGNRESRNGELCDPEEGRDEEEPLEETHQHAFLNGVDGDLVLGGGATDAEPAQRHSFADELNGLGGSGGGEVQDDEEFEVTNGLGSPVGKKRKPVIQVQRPETDAMDVLAQDLESTETFLKHLRTLDHDSTNTTSSLSSRVALSHPSQQPALERYASDIIRRMDEAIRSREGQVRELLEYDREFKRIASGVNGMEVLSRVDELPSLNLDDENVDHDLSSSATLVTPTTGTSPGRPLDTVAEEDQIQNDWEDPHAHFHRDLGEDISPSTSVSPTPTKTTFSQLPPPPPIPVPSKMSPANAIPHLTHIRTFTSSLISSLTTLSEQAQVNGAATTEAGRKIKALKNKMGGWQSDWESAEKSRVKIERWEAGIVDWQNGGEDMTLGTLSPSRLAARRRVDGRKLVEEYLNASEKAIREATERTQAIMAR